MKNKNKHNHHQLKKEKGVRKATILLFMTITAILIGSWFWNVISKSHASNVPYSIATTENELEQYIINKVTTNDVLPGSIPVLIYRFNPSNGDSSVAGSGAIFTGSNGTQLLTCAHVFSIENNGPTNYYAIRKLRPLEGHLVDYCIEGFMPNDQNIANYRSNKIDAVICKVGTHPQPITSFYTKERERAEENQTATLSPFSESRTVKSVLSGEEVPIVGYATNSNALTYFTIIYKSRSGESGTWFVDKEGRRYILKGSNGTLEFMPGSEEQLGYPPHSSYSTIVGPFGAD